jgi:hypothetical protein
MKKILSILVLSILLFSCSTENSVEETKVLKIVGWGDSMMSGAGGEGINIINVIAEKLNISEYYNFGVGGLTSENIAILQGGKPFEISLKNNTITGIDSLTYYNTLPFNNQTHQFREGSLDGVNGTLKKEGNSFYFLSDASKPIAEKIVFKFKDSEQNKGAIVIIWAGRNDGGNLPTFENIKAMTKNNNAYVLSVCNGVDEGFGTQSHTIITELNSQLKEFYGERFIDVREFLVNGSENDCIPANLFSDTVHFNAEGYRLVGEYVAEKIKK